jgi:hypothetical protein
MKGWLDNRFINNGGVSENDSDGAYLSMKTNSVRNNKREGVEINAYGASGSITLKKVSFIENGHMVLLVSLTGAGLNHLVVVYRVNINHIEGNGVAAPLLYEGSNSKRDVRSR